MFVKKINPLTLISSSEVRSRYEWSKVKLWKKVNEGSFPSPIDKNSRKEDVWDVKAIEAFDAERMKRSLGTWDRSLPLS